jgi:hypothetical protein
LITSSGSATSINFRFCTTSPPTDRRRTISHRRALTHVLNLSVRVNEGELRAAHAMTTFMASVDIGFSAIWKSTKPRPR